jgi:adenylate kinase
LDQAKSLDALLGRLGAKIDRVILLDVDPATMSSRIEGRRSCKECKAVYHLENKPPKKAGCCDNPTCGENTLMQREDDTKEKVAVRIQTFLDQTAEVVPFYGDLVKKVPGEGRSPAEIFADVQAIVDPASIQAA